ncbi:flagellar hook assembly protein FlgD [Roseovarius sp.]|uniref:flagellar hook assembly protein FlgD n=1 Tax=Roseovarius sp. TaxID=1486281 RepID=UPI003A981259
MPDINTATGAGATFTAAAAAAAAPTRTGSSDLGQQDFLTLMTAQLQNQDPFAPMENGEFLAQMAQFSTVGGLDTVNATLGEISSQIGGNRIATASSLLGQQVLVPGALARPDASGGVHGVADLPEAANAVTVIYSDAKTGAELHRQDMGAQPAGLMGFDWDDLPPEITQARSAVRVAIEVDGTAPAEPFVYARVVGVQMPETGQDMTLRVEDYGLRSSLEINAIR